MSIETRSTSALFKRAEQLKRWEQSETNREPAQPRQVARKIKFSADCVFLAACAASDKEEVVRLLQKGADINTGNVDGLTALHQACIDDDLDMVEFLVEQGADINRGDNEGWTPLHATASCGFISIAKYLIEQGCNLAAVNNDGELALDIAESDEMEDMLQQHINKAGIDCDQARSEEEQSMLTDAKAWRSGAPGKDSVHPRSGATALHVAAAKGYIKVMHILLQARCNVDAQDFDGWTPLHGAAHWGQLEACKLLVENDCDMDMKNYAGQTAFDVADADILKALENLREQQALIIKENPQTNNKKQSSIPKKRVSTSADSAVTAQESTEIFEEETPNKVKKVELEIQSDKEDSSTSTNSDVEATRETHMEESDGEGESETSSESHSSTFSNQSDKSNHATCLTDDEKKNRVNKDENALHSPISPVETTKVPNQAPILPPKQQTDNNEEGVVPSWRRSGSFRNKMQNTETTNSVSTKLEDKDNNIKIPTVPNKVSGEPDVVLRRTHSFETDEKSFVPPVRDEESETQRKAHAKRVRETRRSTQGVTLDEIKSAEQLVKKKQQNNESPAVIPSTQFQLEDANNKPTDNTTAYMRRPSTGTGIPRPSSAPVETIATSSTETTITLPLRRSSKQPDDKEQDKENDSRNAQATQAVIQRRRRPKRRSTGVVHVDMDEIDPEKQDVTAGGDCDDSKINHNESGNDRSVRANRLGSISSLSSEASSAPIRLKSNNSENGELDYKKLYEESQGENERLKDRLKRSDEQLKEVRSLLEKSQTNQNKVILSEAEKRERRAMERKLSEMEEELKQLQKLKAENERLKAENRALTRVVSKLTNTK
ncbi:protein phosphatase 1 regulatory subunit 12B isoform X4 [Nylanderia fulva]|uniref:protein phosphatase 1 regulatory subunit 12B isoform X4 n=1 Tax=Nylanderia fulva TaxID=613905 RepID=UPI0010FBA685|nr:protein phosphatase 1 regulatory subunit 12B isoform X4 [Nylanderia fulva]